MVGTNFTMGSNEIYSWKLTLHSNFICMWMYYTDYKYSYFGVGMLTAKLKIQIFMSFFGRKNEVETTSEFWCLFNVEMMSAFDVEMMLKRCIIDV